MVDYALTFQGIPYVYGGNGVAAQCYKWSSGGGCSVHKKGVKYTGYDCSGFVTKVMSKYGISMPRTTSAMQSWKPGANGQVLGTGTTRKRGDIILYSGHVAIAISSTQMVHAPSCGKNIQVANTYTKGMTKIFRFYDTGGSNSGGDSGGGGGGGSATVNNNILCSPSANPTQMKNWASGKKATQTFLDNAQYFYDYGKKVGVNPTLAYAQYAWETGYGRYGGQVKESMKNTCGLKNSNNSGFASFSSWNQGIEAHIDHLALYAGASGFPRSGSPDPKHFASLYGKYKTIDAMGLSWAGGEQAYANRLKTFMSEIQTSAGAGGDTSNPGQGNQPTPTGKKVFIDPGHGGSDSGAVGNGLKEKDINLSVGLKVKKLLEERGVSVKMSRETDKAVNLSDRPAQANSWGADCFLSIHCNSASSNSAQGVETFHYSSSDGLAQAVQSQIIANTSLWHKNRGVKKQNFCVIRESKMMSALVELAFINNASDSQLLRDKQDGFAEALARGIIQYLGCNWDNVGTPGGGSSDNDGWEQGAVGAYDPATKYIGQAYNLKGDSLNIRSGPGTGNSVIDKIWEGAKVNVYEVQSNGWLRVKIENGKIGYCSGNYIKRIADPPGKPAPQYVYKVVVPVITTSMDVVYSELDKIKGLGFSNATIESRTL